MAAVVRPPEMPRSLDLTGRAEDWFGGLIFMDQGSRTAAAALILEGAQFIFHQSVPVHEAVGPSGKRWMGRDMVTIEMVAKIAGVSRGTVDRVLHNRGQVKEETADKVWEVMRDLDFQPNTLGRAFSLAKKKNKIGIFLSLREPDFQKQILDGMEDGIAYAQQHGIETQTEVVSPDDEALYLQKIDEMIASEVQGIVLRGIESQAFDARLQCLLDKGIPVFTYNEDVQPRYRKCFVGIDAYRSGKCAALLAQQISPPDGQTLVVGVTPHHKDSEERIRGFLDQWSSTADTRPQIIYGQGYHDIAYSLTREALSRTPAITGIFVSGAGLSGVAQAVYEQGTPGTPKVVGFDATPSNISYLKKGTVQFLIDQSPYIQGYKSIQMLVDYLFEGTAPKCSSYHPDIQIKNVYSC